MVLDVQCRKVDEPLGEEGFHLSDSPVDPPEGVLEWALREMAPNDPLHHNLARSVLQPEVMGDPEPAGWFDASADVTEFLEGTLDVQNRRHRQAVFERRAFTLFEALVGRDRGPKNRVVRRQEIARRGERLRGRGVEG